MICGSFLNLSHNAVLYFIIIIIIIILTTFKYFFDFHLFEWEKEIGKLLLEPFPNSNSRSQFHENLHL